MSVTMCAVDTKESTTSILQKKAVDAQTAAKVSEEPSRPVLTYGQFTKVVIAGVLCAAVNIAFSLTFPFALAPEAAPKTYHFAFFHYDADKSHFDNTAWTWATDYGLAIAISTIMLNTPSQHKVSRTHAQRSWMLLLCYVFSVLAGGIAHQFYTTLEGRNSLSFRFLWTICVGTVSAATGPMGSIGTELVRHDHALGLKHLPVVPAWLWATMAIVATVVVALGGFSFNRPACDIFIAGTSQFASTVYMMLVFMFGLPTHPVKRWARVAGAVGFLFNAPLLPMYPLLVQYTDWSLASVNTLLHAWLLVGWGLQGLALRSVEQSLTEAATPPAKAVPIKRTAKKTE
jgi:hypothetical protein